MSIGSAIFVKDSFILGEGSKSNIASVDVVSSTELLSERQLEEYDYDTEYENIYKTNISLSEPLRSVGDIHDRLFRGSDGLWKIEQNIEPIHPEDGTRTIEETYGVLDSPIYKVLPQELQDKLNNIRSFQDSNYVYTIINGASDILSENLKPTLHVTFKGGGWYTRFKSDQEFIKTQEQIGNKADIEVIDDLKKDLNDYAKQEDYLTGIGEVNSSLEAYQSLLETIEKDLKGERDENGEFVLDANGNPINVGAIKEIEDIVNREAAINLNLGELSARWNFIGTNIVMASEGLLIGETGVDENGTEIVITGIRISKDRVDFVQNKIIVAEITGSRMKINRAIFVESITVGEHKIETVSSGHTIWTWVPTI